MLYSSNICNLPFSMQSDPSAVQVFQYWRSLCRGVVPPSRFDLDPTRMLSCLPNTFILEHEGANQFRYRFAGRAIQMAVGKELKRRAFSELWSHSEREAAELLLCNIRLGSYIGGICAEAYAAHNQVVRCSTMLLPLRYGAASVSRILGYFSTASKPSWMGKRALIRMTIREVSLRKWTDIPAQLPAEETADTEVAEQPSNNNSFDFKHLTVINGALSQRDSANIYS